MTKRIKPHDAFSVARPDEVAETWEGIPDDLYASLWRVAEMMPSIPNREDSGPHDHIGFNCVADFWSKFTDDERRALNEAAERTWRMS